MVATMMLSWSSVLVVLCACPVTVVVDGFGSVVQSARAAFLLQQRHVVVSTLTADSLLVSTDRVVALPQVEQQQLQHGLSTTAWTMVAVLDDVDVGGIVRTVAVGVTALVFLLAGLTYITASILIPAGAEQLEIECQQFIPETWKDYQAKLETGQQMKDRPDLMFELGLLLNKAKADELRRACETSGYLDLWTKYQDLLGKDQQLQDRPDLIQQLYREVADRQAEAIRRDCPPDVWDRYESQLQPGETMSGRPDLMNRLLQELADSDDGPTPNFLTAGGAPTTVVTSQWDDDDGDEDQRPRS
jgi:hypothetical protein